MIYHDVYHRRLFPPNVGSRLRWKPEKLRNSASLSFLHKSIYVMCSSTNLYFFKKGLQMGLLPEAFCFSPAENNLSSICGLFSTYSWKLSVFSKLRSVFFFFSPFLFLSIFVQIGPKLVYILFVFFFSTEGFYIPLFSSLFTFYCIFFEAVVSFPLSKIIYLPFYAFFNLLSQLRVFFYKQILALKENWITFHAWTERINWHKYSESENFVLTFRKD